MSPRLGPNRQETGSMLTDCFILSPMMKGMNAADSTRELQVLFQVAPKLWMRKVARGARAKERGRKFRRFERAAAGFQEAKRRWKVQRYRSK